MVIPILPFYIIEFGAGGSAMGMLMASYAIMQFIFSPIWGSISDRIGRKPVLMIGVLGFGITQLIFGFSSALWMLFAARIMAGVLSSATLPTAMAYIGDSTTERDRGEAWASSGQQWGLAWFLVPGLPVGWQHTHYLCLSSLQQLYHWYLWCSFTCCCLNPCQLKNARLEAHLSRDHSSGRCGRPYLPPRIAALHGLPGQLRIDQLRDRFRIVRSGDLRLWSPAGRWLADLHRPPISYSPGRLDRPLYQTLGEVAIIKVSLLGSALGFVMMVMARSFFAVLFTMGFFIISNAMLRPAVSALISKRSTVGQGVAMGLNNSFMSLGRSVGPLWAGFAYDINSGYPYWSGALIMLVGFVISLLRLKPDKAISPIEGVRPVVE